MADDGAPADRKVLWTPEQKMQAFKETMAGILALCVVGFTLHLSWTTFDYVGQEEKMADAKDVLLLMLGLCGVVVGYYFGRVPADARAAMAQDQANAATAHSEMVSAKAQAMADAMVDAMENATDGSRGLTAQPQDNLVKLREELRALADFSRRYR